MLDCWLSARMNIPDKESENASAHRLASSMNENCPVRISQQHRFYFISLSIYLYDIGEIAGGCTRREPPDNIVIDSISPIYLSIYPSDIGEITGGYTRREPPAILSSTSFIYLYLFVNMGKCQHFIDLCHLSIYLSI
jgi:hypothetical protein